MFIHLLETLFEVSIVSGAASAIFLGNDS